MLLSRDLGSIYFIFPSALELWPQQHSCSQVRFIHVSAHGRGKVTEQCLAKFYRPGLGSSTHHFHSSAISENSHTTTIITQGFRIKKGNSQPGSYVPAIIVLLQRKRRIDFQGQSATRNYVCTQANVAHLPSLFSLICVTEIINSKAYRSQAGKIVKQPRLARDM